MGDWNPTTMEGRLRRDAAERARAEFGGPSRGRVPAGTVIMGAWKAVPEGHLECDGASYDPRAIPSLWSAIGTQFGRTATVLMTNLVPNPRAFANTAGFVGATGAGTVTLRRDTGATPLSSVNTAIRSTNDTASSATYLDIRTDTVPATAGATYSASGYMRAVSSASALEYILYVQFLNSAGSVILTTQASTPSAGTEWVEVWNEGVVAPTGTTGVRLYYRAVGPIAVGDYIHITAMTLTPTAVRQPFFDGSTADNTDEFEIFDTLTTTGVHRRLSVLTIAVPDMRGQAPVGRAPSDADFADVGKKGGAKTHQLSVAEMPSHTHVQNAHNHVQSAHQHTLMVNGNTQLSLSAVASGSGAFGVQTGTAGSPLGTGPTTQAQANTTPTNQNTGGGGAHNNLQPYVTLFFAIKT
jgi:microcystin-dependent protein